MEWQPQIFSADSVHSVHYAIHGGHWCLKQYLYLMPRWPLEPAADSLPHAIHGGHGSVMQSLLPHVITVTGVKMHILYRCHGSHQCTTYIRKSKYSHISHHVQCLYMFLCMYMSAGCLQSLWMYVQYHL